MTTQIRESTAPPQATNAPDATGQLTTTVSTAPEYAVKVVVPFAYDLGGRIENHEEALRTITGIPGVVPDGVHIDRAAARTWNLSYLAGHQPVIVADLESGSAQFGNETWEFDRRLRVVPWLGVATVVYEFRPPTALLSTKGFYDHLVQWKNRDYVPYLISQDAISERAREQIGWVGDNDELDLHGSLIRELRARFRQAAHAQGKGLTPAFTPRSGFYAFHDFRTIFVFEGATSELSGEIDDLLNLAESDNGGDRFTAERVTYRGMSVRSTGWSTVIESPSQDAEALASVLDLVALIHAQWFVCQSWIFVYDADNIGRFGSGRDVAPDFAKDQLTLAHDLVEVDNLDLMFKDPSFLVVAATLSSAFKVRQHLQSAERRLNVIDDFARRSAEASNARDSQRLQILFSLSAAATLAGLVPAMATLQDSLAVGIIVAVVGLGLWAGFAVNFAVVLRRFRRGKAPLRARSARRNDSWHRPG